MQNLAVAGHVLRGRAGELCERPGPGDHRPPPVFAQAQPVADQQIETVIVTGSSIRGLAAPVHTRRVQLAEGVPVVTDGPYAETQEVLAGYWIVDCDSFDRATEIAARLSGTPGPAGAAEDAVADVRPIAESQAEPEL